MVLHNRIRCKREVLLKKTILCFTGTLLIGLGVTMFLKSGLGSDPISVFVEGLHILIKTSIGNASLISNIIILSIALIIGRRYIFIGTVIGAIFTGLAINFFEPYLVKIFSVDSFYSIRLIMIVIGHFIVCLGIALNLSAEFGFSPADCIITAISDKTGWQYRYLKIATDASFTICGFILGGVIGIGTILSVATGGPLISEIKKLLEKTLLKWIGLKKPTVDTVEVAGT
ncbi:MAG: hypothetical protein PHE70_09695 [Tepidanaerobacteraceae bacterium]|nr:hypothetical protein [Tepidanaerobacteraceae bacterium]